MDPEEGTPSLERAIGRNVRRLREARHLSQGALAAELRSLGVTGDQSSVARLERGSRGVPASELLALAATFDVPVVTLLESLEPVQVGDVAWPQHFARAAAEGLAYSLPGWDRPTTWSHTLRPAPIAELTEWIQAQTRYRARWNPDSDRVSDWHIARDAVTRLEQLTAERLRTRYGLDGVAPVDVVAASAMLWGRPLQEERDRRADEELEPGAGWARIRTVRGWAMKLMVEELVEAITDAVDRGLAVELEQADRSVS